MTHAPQHVQNRGIHYIPCCPFLPELARVISDVGISGRRARRLVGSDQFWPYSDALVMSTKRTKGEVERLIEIEKPAHKHLRRLLRDCITVGTGNPAFGTENPVYLITDSGKCLRLWRVGRGGTAAQPEDVPIVAVGTVGSLIEGDVSEEPYLVRECTELALKGDVPVGVVFDDQGCAITFFDNP